MYEVELYLRVRRACMVDGMSIREASRVFGLHRDTVRKMLAYSVPSGCRRRKPPRRPGIGPYTGVIVRTLEDTPSFSGSSATPPSASTSVSDTSMGSTAGTRYSRTTSESTVDGHGR